MSLKEEIRNQIIEIQKKELKGLQQMLKTYSEAADLDEESTLDPDDFSQQNQNFESADNLSKRIARAKQTIDSFLNLPVAGLQKVEPGALVLTDSLNFYIGISTKQFQYEKKAYFGLNTDAPVYKALGGAKPGDDVVFNGQEYKILEIL